MTGVRARLVALAAAAAAVGASGGMSRMVSLEGIVGNFDAKTVDIKSPGGEKTTVPRDSIPPRYKIRSGERVTAVLDSREFFKGLAVPPGPSGAGGRPGPGKDKGAAGNPDAAKKDAAKKDAAGTQRTDRGVSE